MNCHFCQTAYERGVNGCHWFASALEEPHGGHYERVNLCLDCFHAGRLESAPRRQRAPRARIGLYGDFAMLAQFHGIRTDGSGKRAR